MTGIEINGELLDLDPGTTLEIERQNPFLQFGTSITGSYSFPFNVKNTERNRRLLNYNGVWQKQNDAGAIDTILYDNSLQLFRGKLRIEKPTVNINKSSATSFSCYVLTDISDFWKDAELIKLRSINTGGERSFVWDDENPSGAGFWGHIHAVANGAVNAYDYAFFPVINKAWEPYETAEATFIMNNVEPDGTGCIFTTYATISPSTIKEPNRIVPFPYLHFVISKIFEHIGWTVNGDVFDDADFLKITMVNFRAIDWCIPSVGGLAVYLPHETISFNLSDHLPDITISEFLIALKNRFGFEFKVDSIRRTFGINWVKTIKDAEVVDYTNYANPKIERGFFTSQTKYSLVNDDGQGGGFLDTNVVNYTGIVNQKSDLPAAGETYYNHVKYVCRENNYYICELNDDSSYSWNLLTYNLYDYKVTDSNEDITSKAGTTGMEAYDSYLTLLPRIDISGEWFGRSEYSSAWGIHLVFFHGLKAISSGSTQRYPYASAHIYDPSGNQVAQYGLSFTCYQTDGTDVGLYITFWKDFLTLISAYEECEIKLMLPLDKYLSLGFDKIISISGVNLLIKKKNEKFPYKGIFDITAIRV